MKVIGLTGGIGMGKSVVARMFARRGVAVVDTDDLAREVVRPGQPALAEVQALFGPGVIGPDGALNRAELARRVFASEVSRKQLEAILHPRIRAIWLERVEEWRKAGHAAGVVVIPLLFETHSEKHFDPVICVACSGAVQAERLRARGMTAEQIEARNRAQWAIERKMELADHVIWNEGALPVTEEQVGQVLHTLALKDAHSLRERGIDAAETPGSDQAM